MATNGTKIAPLTNRHRLVALMDLEGSTDKAISESTGYTPSRISQLRKSPLYQAYLSDLRERLEAKRIDSIADMLRATAKKSIERLEMLRDNGPGDVPYNVQATCASKLVDHAYGIEKQATDPANARRDIILSPEAAQRIAHILVEAGHKMGQPKEAVPIHDMAVTRGDEGVANAVLAEQ